MRGRGDASGGEPRLRRLPGDALLRALGEPRLGRRGLRGARSAGHPPHDGTA